MLFIALVLVPITRRLEDAALRTRLVQDTGRRFRTVGWIALGLIVATGLGNLAMRPDLSGRRTCTPRPGSSGSRCCWAHCTTSCSGPAPAGRAPRPPRVRASWIARVNVLIALAIVALGLALRG
jgi:hypothetical protein